MKKVVILGASGSIGTQAIDVIRNNPDKYELIAISVDSSYEFLNSCVKEFSSITDICINKNLEKVEVSCNIHTGIDGLISIATLSEADVILTAVVGSVGLLPTIEAIKAKKTIALANKETLVTAGHIIMPLAKEYEVSILPVDSEHSAIFQALNGECNKEIYKIILTASGGSFRDKTREELENVNVQEALNHPNWNMGKKITIDSATMFNKGLEIIEAHHLFGVSYDEIEVLIHKQSIIHSMVEYVDGSVIAQLGTPDMRLPIQYALTYPKRKEIINSERLDLASIGTLDFTKVDFSRFPAVKLAYDAGRKGGNLPTILNAANEVVVELFLKEKIKFIDIEKYVRDAMDSITYIANPSIDEIISTDEATRKFIKEKYDY